MSGTARVTTPGKVKLRLTVTKAGRKLAKTKTPFQLVLTSSFRPTGGATVKTTHTARLK